jgi:sulfur-oxidizing protein SoxA
MKKLSLALSASLLFGATSIFAAPADDLAKFQDYFKAKFPETAQADFINGVYSIDAGSREQWESVEEFPPYEGFVDQGEELWNTKFANGKTYGSCFGDKDVSELKVMFPHWDKAKSRVQTLESALNECREANGEKALKWKKGKMAHLSAYISFSGRGKKINVVIPDDPKAQAAYEDGKRFFYAKRGQLNLSCADCHVYSSGRKVRADLLSPGLGQVSHFPVFRAKWSGGNTAGDGLGTLHRRYGGCNKQVRAKPFKAQSTEYRNLEFFHTYMSNGLELNGPGYRK